MRKLLIMFAALVVAAASSLLFVSGTRAQNPIKRTEPIASAVLESPTASIEVRLEEPRSAEADGSFSFALVKPSAEDNDDRVTIALATFGVAVAAVVVGLLGYLLRVRLGLVKPPPPPEEQHGSH